MSTITGLSGTSSYLATLGRQLFQSIDQNSDGTVNQTELEQAFAANGGTTQGADQLFSQLDSSGTGAITSDQFVTGLQSLLSSTTQGALIQAQSDQSTQASAAATPHHHGHHGGGGTQALEQLFGSIDSITAI